MNVYTVNVIGRKNDKEPELLNIWRNKNKAIEGMKERIINDFECQVIVNCEIDNIQLQLQNDQEFYVFGDLYYFIKKEKVNE